MLKHCFGTFNRRRHEREEEKERESRTCGNFQSCIFNVYSAVFLIKSMHPNNSSKSLSEVEFVEYPGGIFISVTLA